MSVSGKWVLKTRGPCAVLLTSGIGQAGLWPAQPTCPSVSPVWARAESDTPATLWVTSLAERWEGVHFQVAELSRFSIPQCLKFFTQVEGDKDGNGSLQASLGAFFSRASTQQRPKRLHSCQAFPLIRDSWAAIFD